ncbi:hypothetical protein STEG23_030829 [Scotinomys teguina]
MARKVGQWEEEEVAQSHEEEERCQPAKRRRCRVTDNENLWIARLVWFDQPRPLTALQMFQNQDQLQDNWLKDEASQTAPVKIGPSS